jgi:alpha-ketoglutarate-dependent taurine dioxygenase
MEIRPLSPGVGAEVIGFEPRIPLDNDTRDALRAAFDDRGVLIFRDLELDLAGQVYLSLLLIGQEHTVTPGETGDHLDWYISNQREAAAAPYGRLQFHADGMWADDPFQVLSLYGEEVEQPAVPTIFVSGVDAWRTLPADLRARVDRLDARHTSGRVARRDLTDVLVLEVEDAPSTVKPLAMPHPRTGQPVLYACEQMTAELVGLDPAESETLLDELFDHMYAPERRVHHEWRAHDLVVWDNISLQHCRPNVQTEGPARTLRKVGYPMPQMSAEQMPKYGGTR